MAYVPLGYQAGGEGQFDVSQIHGASPWGASTLAGADGSRQPSQLELKCALKHGRSLRKCCEEVRGTNGQPQVQGGGDLLQHVARFHQKL